MAVPVDVTDIAQQFRSSSGISTVSMGARCPSRGGCARDISTYDPRALTLRAEAPYPPLEF